jgi:hypothetical protein
VRELSHDVDTTLLVPSATQCMLRSGPPRIGLSTLTRSSLSRTRGSKLAMTLTEALAEAQTGDVAD